jgi:hypothetical protein
MNVTERAEACELLEALPLGQAGMMAFELIPLGPMASTTHIEVSGSVSRPPNSGGGDGDAPGWFAADSPLEGTGFEPSVPLGDRNSRRGDARRRWLGNSGTDSPLEEGVDR